MHSICLQQTSQTNHVRARVTVHVSRLSEMMDGKVEEDKKISVKNNDHETLCSRNNFKFPKYFVDFKILFQNK